MFLVQSLRLCLELGKLPRFKDEQSPPAENIRQDAKISMALESAAFFAKRVKELGLGEYQSVMADNGWSTMGTFAFSANYVPGGVDDSKFMEEVVVPVLGDQSHVLKAALRRLFFDSYAMVAADAQ
eukprot:558044-Karenia_brevis.AAC.1